MAAKNELKIHRHCFLSSLASASAGCSSFAQSFVQVSLDSIKEVRCVDVMFIQLAAAGAQSITCDKYTLMYFIKVIRDTVGDSLGQAVDAACKVLGHHTIFHSFHTDFF